MGFPRVEHDNQQWGAAPTFAGLPGRPQLGLAWNSIVLGIENLQPQAPLPKGDAYLSEGPVFEADCFQIQVYLGFSAIRHFLARSRTVLGLGNQNKNVN
ncbi:MAG TPA: hypothetical protein DIT46_08160 [Gemmatimonadetes bacterium]|nr:hypothetical protein [Gemmatimonadota bacterium]